MRSWLYYSIYIPRIEYLDNVIKNIVIPIVNDVKNQVHVHTWFFIRYIDMQGPHIRLRFHIDTKDLEVVEELITSILEKELEILASSPPSKIARLLPVQSIPE